MIGEHIKFSEARLRPIQGHAGLETQLPGRATTVGNLASGTGGIKRGNIVSTDK